MTRYFYSALLLLIAGLFVTGCEIANEEDNTKSFLIVDQSDNKVLNNYEYSKDSNILVRTESYTPDQKVKKSIEYEYDSSGNLTRTTEKSIGYPIKIISYETEEIHDDQGRLIQTIRTSSEGELLETFYGYDENSKLRGVVEYLNKDSVLMKDYDNN